MLGDGSESEQLLQKPDPPEERPNGASLGSGVLNLTNTLLGGGIAFIALPVATKQVGVLLLVALILLSGLANAFTCTLLVKSAEISNMRSYFDLSAAALGPWRHLVTLFIFFNNFGVCIAFIATFGDTFPSVMRQWHGGFLVHRVDCVAVVTLVLLLPMLTLTKLDSLRILSGCSIVLCLFFAGVVVASSAEADRSPPDADEISFVTFLQALSVITLSFTCHYNILPVQNELSRPAGIRAIINISMVVSSMLFCLVGTFAFYCHPDTTGDILADFSSPVGAAGELGAGPGSATTVARLGVAAALLFTFPLIAFEGVHCAGALLQVVVDASCSSHGTAGGASGEVVHVHEYRKLLAFVFTLLASIPGALGADTSAVIGFVGSFCGIPVSQ